MGRKWIILWHWYQNLSDLLKSLQNKRSLGSGTCFLPSLLFLPRIGLNNFFRTLWNADPRPRLGPCITWVTRGIGAMLMSNDWDLGIPGSERLLPSIDLFMWASKDFLSNSSNSVLYSSPNLFRITAISTNCLFVVVVVVVA